MKGMLLVVPSDAPNIQKLRQWMSAQDLDKIEKYAYQNASGYELFADQWKTTTELIRLIPVERADLENKLRGSNHIEMADSSKIYLLQITAKYMRGEAMPVEYACPPANRENHFKRPSGGVHAQRARTTLQRGNTNEKNTFL